MRPSNPRVWKVLPMICQPTNNALCGGDLFWKVSWNVWNIAQSVSCYNTIKNLRTGCKSFKQTKNSLTVLKTERLYKITNGIEETMNILTGAYRRRSMMVVVWKVSGYTFQLIPADCRLRFGIWRWHFNQITFVRTWVELSVDEPLGSLKWMSTEQLFSGTWSVLTVVFWGGALCIVSKEVASPLLPWFGGGEHSLWRVLPFPSNRVSSPLLPWDLIPWFGGRRYLQRVLTITHGFQAWQCCFPIIIGIIHRIFHPSHLVFCIHLVLKRPGSKWWRQVLWLRHIPRSSGHRPRWHF